MYHGSAYEDSYEGVRVGRLRKRETVFKLSSALFGQNCLLANNVQLLPLTSRELVLLATCCCL